MEAQLLRLTPPPGRSYYIPDSPPSSPRHAFSMEEVEEAPLGEVRAAIPFLWELTPGTPKDDFEMPEVEEEEEEVYVDSSSDEAPAPVTPPALRLPPRLQHLQSCSDGVSSRMTLCGAMRSEEVTVLGMQQQQHESRRQRIRSFLSSSDPPSFSRDSFLSSSSSFSSRHSLRSSSSFSSSSFSSSTSPQAPDGKGRTLNDLVPDTSSVVSRKETRIPVESRRELLLHKHHMELSSSPAAKSIPTSLRPSRREHLGRALFANRLGLLGSCLGELPRSH